MMKLTQRRYIDQRLHYHKGLWYFDSSWETGQWWYFQEDWQPANRYSEVLVYSQMEYRRAHLPCLPWGYLFQRTRQWYTLATRKATLIICGQNLQISCSNSILPWKWVTARTISCYSLTKTCCSYYRTGSSGRSEVYWGWWGSHNICFYGPNCNVWDTCGTNITDIL
jgi:hypothetical protein